MRKTKINIILALVFSIVFLLTNTVYAAGSFSVSANGTMNLSATQTMSISTNGCAGKFSVKSSNSSVVSVSSSSIFVDGTEKITLTAKGAGTATITVTAVDVLDPSYNEVTGSKSVTITVKGADTGSGNAGSTGGSTNTGSTGNTGNNGSSGSTNTGSTSTQNKPSNVATLKNLGIKPNDFSGFKPGKYNYSVTVENNVDKVTVYASTTHNKASWSVSGANVAGINGKTVSLKEGTNNIYVTVKAEDGTIKKYTISVTRKSSEGEVIPNVIDDQEFEQVGVTEGLGLKTLEIEGLTLNPEFKTDTYEYTIEVNDEEILSLEELKNKMKYEANFENPLIEVQSEKEDFEQGENLVYIIVKDTEKELAKYTLKINLKEEKLVVGAVTEEIDTTPTDVAPVIQQDKLILISAIALLGIISIVIMIRYYMVSQRLEIFENEIEFKDIENTNSLETAAEKLEKLSEMNSAEVEFGAENRRTGGRRRGGKHRER